MSLKNKGVPLRFLRPKRAIKPLLLLKMKEFDEFVASMLLLLKMKEFDEFVASMLLKHKGRKSG
jgi:hypothetical protein